MLKKFKRNGQTTAEYAILIIIVMGALLAANVYFKRGLQGRWKIAVDDLGDQYDPRLANSVLQHTIFQNTATTLTAFNVVNGFYTLRHDITNTVETKTGHLTVGGSNF